MTMFRRVLRRAGLDPAAAGSDAPEVIAAAAALFAAGLNPAVFGPAITSLELAARLRPELEFAFLLSVLVSGAMYLVGGLLGDAYGRRRIMLVGLAAVAVSSAASLVVEGPPLFLVVRLVAAAAVGLVIPSAIAAAAVPFTRQTRVVTISIAFVALGIGGAVGIILLAAVAEPIGYGPSLAVAGIAAAYAFYRVRRDIDADAPNAPVRFRDVGAHVLWAFGLLAVTTSIIGLGGRAEPLRLSLGFVGLVSVLLGLRLLRTGRERGIDLRPVAFALIAGVILAFSQSAPLLVLPKVLRYLDGYGPVLAVLGVAPLFIGFLLAGPLGGRLSDRFSPRTLIAVSLAVVGVADLGVAVAIAAEASSLIIAVLPLLVIGVGFIVGTSVRTAVIFSSVTRRLPSTAASLNQTSILIGSQLGVMVLTIVVGATALATYRAGAEGLDPGVVETGAMELERLLRAIDTPDFVPLVVGLTPDAIERYSAAFRAGAEAGLVAAGLLALAGAIVTWLGMRGDEPLSSRYDYLEERTASGARSEDLEADERLDGEEHPDPEPE